MHNKILIASYSLYAFGCILFLGSVLLRIKSRNLLYVSFLLNFITIVSVILIDYSLYVDITKKIQEFSPLQLQIQKIVIIIYGILTTCINAMIVYLLIFRASVKNTLMILKEAESYGQTSAN